VLPDSLPVDSAQQASLQNELSERYGPFAGTQQEPARQFTIETETLSATFDTKGGRLSQVVLKEFVTYDSLPLVLMDEASSRFGIRFPFRNGVLTTDELLFSTDAQSINLSGEQQHKITARAGSGEAYVEFEYTFTGNSYEVGFAMRTIGLQREMDLSSRPPVLHMGMTSFPNEKHLETERINSAVYYKPEGRNRDYLSESSDDEELVKKNLQWVAFKQNFFSVILFPENTFPEGSVLANTVPTEDEHVKHYDVQIPLSIRDAANGSAQMDIFFGPNKYKVLKPYGNDAHKIINLGWGIFGWVNMWIVIPIFDFLESFNLGYGLIILLLTIAIKMMVFPLTYKNYLSSAKMRVLKPEIDELNEKHKDADPMKKQQATLDLYRKTGVNPFAGCVPMVIQMPILYAMFRFFPASIELRQQSFLWAEDLSTYDSIATLPFDIPFYGTHVSLFTLLMAASTLFYTVYNSSQLPQQNQPGMPNMKVIMYMFPFMMIFIFNSFASGLSYYYFLANMISIAQMQVIKNFWIDENKIRLQITENKKKPESARKSKFQQRLEEMARQKGINPAK
jgi:YidC/Oxa1 family membrane protein insertase